MRVEVAAEQVVYFELAKLGNSEVSTKNKTRIGSLSLQSQFHKIL
jgi:hypothetical protein